jgi:lysophospholipase L1-like esterase
MSWLGTGWGTPPRWAWVVMVVGLVTLVVLTPIAMRRGTVPAGSVGFPAATPTTGAVPESPSATPTSGAPTGDRPTIAVLGDSFTADADPATGPAGTEWPELLAQQYPWTVTAFAADGSGFVTEDAPGTAFLARAEQVIAAQPDVVVVAGGHDDVDQPPGVLVPAARQVLTRLRAGLPDARLLVVGVLWSGQPAGYVTADNNALRGLAAEVGAPFADAFGEGWLTAAGQPLVTPDGAHPTAAGQAVIAQHIGAALVAAGVPATG